MTRPERTARECALGSGRGGRRATKRINLALTNTDEGSRLFTSHGPNCRSGNDQPHVAEAASDLQIQKAYHNSRAPINGSNTSLNAEWVPMKNVTSVTKYLTGWAILCRTDDTLADTCA